MGREEEDERGGGASANDEDPSAPARACLRGGNQRAGERTADSPLCGGTAPFIGTYAWRVRHAPRIYEVIA